MTAKQTLSAAIAAIFPFLQGIQPACAELPMLQEQPGLGYFAVAEARAYQFFFGTDGPLAKTLTDTFKMIAYRACGFEAVGASAGFSRDSRDYYTAHDQPKQLYLRELRPNARKLLCRPRLPSWHNAPCPQAPPSNASWAGMTAIHHSSMHRLKASCD